MPNAYVLMTALPPTTGHADLITFAKNFMFRKSMLDDTFSGHDQYQTEVIVSTQPSEPFAEERMMAIADHFWGSRSVNVNWFHEEIEQNPEAEGFWDMWREIMASYGFKAGDYVFASEPYGQRLAEECGGVFIPYDLDRQINPVKATSIRNSPRGMDWKNILPEFKRYITPRITVFGAESCGKTTMTRLLGNAFAAQTLPEWARPYLESVGAEITTEKMDHIYLGQAVIQTEARDNPKKSLVIQDTDLYSTIGYWEMWDKESIPQALYNAARNLRSDLYLIMSSEIPFEEDQLRYGGKVRESTDQYWIDLCERFDLPYVYITGKGQYSRAEQCSAAVSEAIRKKVTPLSSYQRKFNG